MTYHIIICTGRPASGKTTLLKELESSGLRDARYIDADQSPIKRALSGYYGHKELLDTLIMNTKRLRWVLDSIKEVYALHKPVTIYRFEDNKQQCLDNDLNRPDHRRATLTINEPYDIDFESIIKDYSELKIEVIDVPVYRISRWESFYNVLKVKLSYKTIDYYSGEINEIIPGRVNKRYIISDYWSTDRREKHYDSDWDEHWVNEDDDTPLAFKELDNFLAHPNLNLSYPQGLDIKNLAEVVSYEVSDYYIRETRNYLCIDAELLYNYLMSAQLLED